MQPMIGDRAATVTDHFFGSQSTDLKLEIIEKYLNAFTKALRGKFRRLWYIDAFAGTGTRSVEHKAQNADLVHEAKAARIEQRKGSATIALETAPPFDRVVFIDLLRRHCLALEQLKTKYPGRQIDVLRGDANSRILEIIEGQKWNGTRAVIFLDPYGMHVDWTTLEAIRATEAIDVWYLVSLEGLFRQAAKNPEKLTDHKRAKVTAMVGCDDWEAEWYPTAPVGDLLALMGVNEPAPSGRRTATIGEMEAFFNAALRACFRRSARLSGLKTRVASKHSPCSSQPQTPTR